MFGTHDALVRWHSHKMTGIIHKHISNDALNATISSSIGTVMNSSASMTPPPPATIHNRSH